MGNDWVCWANEGALQNIWLLPCCWESVVALVCAQCQLWGASPLFVLCQGELQRNWNLSNHSFLDCEYTGFHLLNSVNGEQISELQRSTGKGTACSLSDGGEGYCTLSPLVNLPFMRVYECDILICYCYIQLPVFPGVNFDLRHWGAAGVWWIRRKPGLLMLCAELFSALKCMGFGNDFKISLRKGFSAFPQIHCLTSGQFSHLSMPLSHPSHLFGLETLQSSHCLFKCIYFVQYLAPWGSCLSWNHWVWL